MNEQNRVDDTHASEQGERIAAEGARIRERVRETVERMVHERRVGIGQLSQVAGDVFDGAVRGVRSLAPAERENRLRQVVDGVADAVTRTANATRLAFQETSSRGQAFAKEEVDKTISDLRVLQDQFVEVLTRVTNRASHEMKDQVHALNEHIRRTSSDVRKPIEDALRAAADHPVKFAGDAAGAGLRAVPKAAGLLMQAVGGALQGAGDALSGKRRESEKSSD